MFACDERTSIAWARDRVRGIASRLIAVTPRSASCCMRPGSMSGVSSPTSAWPERSFAASASVGFWTFTTQSAWAYTSSAETIVAPASSYAVSGNAAAVPAPRSTRISIPAASSLARASGTSATRRSPGRVSLGTPTFMWAPGVRGMAYRIPCSSTGRERVDDDSGRHHRDAVALERGDRASVSLRNRHRPSGHHVDHDERHARGAHQAVVVDQVRGTLDGHAAVADPCGPHVHVEQLVEACRRFVRDLERPHDELALALPVRLEPKVPVILQPGVVEVGEVAPVVDDPLGVRIGERHSRERGVPERRVLIGEPPGLEVRHARIVRRRPAGICARSGTRGVAGGRRVLAEPLPRVPWRVPALALCRVQLAGSHMKCTPMASTTRSATFG